MTTAAHSTSTAGKLEPREVEKLISYTMGEMERMRLLYVGPSGQAAYVGTSRKKLTGFVKDTLRLAGTAERSRWLIDQHITEIVQAERISYGGSAETETKKAPTLQRRGEVKQLGGLRK